MTWLSFGRGSLPSRSLVPCCRVVSVSLAAASGVVVAVATVAGLRGRRSRTTWTARHLLSQSF